MKKLLTVLLCLLMVLSLSACGKKQSDEPGQKTTITVWGTWTNAQLDALNKYCADFTASQDKYIVEYKGQTYPMDQTLTNAVANNVGPDFVIDYASTASKLHELGKVADLSKYLSKDVISQLTDGAYAESHSYIDDGMYNYPLVLSGPVLWFNEEVLKAANVEVPTTWEELFAASKKITETVTVVTDENGNKKFVTDGSGSKVYGFASDSHQDLVTEWIKGLGCDVYDAKADEVLFNNEKVAAYLQQYADGCKGEYILPSATTDYVSTDFNAGVVAMYYGSVAGKPYLGQYTSNPVGGITAVAAKVPSVADGTPWTAAWNRGGIVFDYGDEDRVKGACAFLEYLASQPVNEDWCKVCNYQSNIKWTISSDSYKAFLADNEVLACLQPEIAGALDAIPAASAIRDALKNLLTSVGSGVEVSKALNDAVTYIANNK